MKGIFITLEGPDGSGKSTQIDLLKKYFNKIGREVILTREPGGTVISEKIREVILDNDHTEMSYVTEALLYAASRAQHVDELILPALNEGKIVICDRFVDSSYVYQGIGRGLGDIVKIINDIAIKGQMPDITFLFKIDPAIGKSRVTSNDRLDMESITYHEKVYEAYIELEKLDPKRIKPIDASKSIEAVHQQILSYINELITQ